MGWGGETGQEGRGGEETGTVGHTYPVGRVVAHERKKARWYRAVYVWEVRRARYATPQNKNKNKNKNKTPT